MSEADLVLFALLGGTALLLYGVHLVGEGGREDGAGAGCGFRRFEPSRILMPQISKKVIHAKPMA